MLKELRHWNTGETSGGLLKFSTINCEINLILTWSASRTFTITDKTPFILVVTLSTQDSTKLKLGSKCTVNWDKYQSKISTQAKS